MPRVVRFVWQAFERGVVGFVISLQARLVFTESAAALSKSSITAFMPCSAKLRTSSGLSLMI